MYICMWPSSENKQTTFSSFVRCYFPEKHRKFANENAHLFAKLAESVCVSSSKKVEMGACNCLFRVSGLRNAITELQCKNGVSGSADYKAAQIPKTETESQPAGLTAIVSPGGSRTFKWANLGGKSRYASPTQSKLNPPTTHVHN